MLKLFALLLLASAPVWAAPAPAAAEPPPYRLGADDIAVVINRNDPYSQEVGAYYAKVHQVPAENIIEIDLPVKAEITPAELEKARTQLNNRLGHNIEALALAWTQPWKVSCQSITSAFTLGLTTGVCQNSCAPTPPSAYFNSPSVRPWQEVGLRPSMLLAADNVANARAMIDRGVAAWGTQPRANAWFVQTADKARSVRAPMFPRDQYIAQLKLTVHRVQAESISNQKDIVVYETGRATVDDINTLGFVPGALADHLTSYGGVITGPNGQMSILHWLDAGATASYGTVSEPCSHPQKFPHPQVLLLHYLAGATALEAYWKSVAWPAQGLFVGDPLAAPYRRLSAFK